MWLEDAAEKSRSEDQRLDQGRLRRPRPPPGVRISDPIAVGPDLLAGPRCYKPCVARLVLIMAGAIAAITAGATVALAYVQATTGEVYRVWLDGRRSDLSRSTADDTFPVVSPDGRHVAFVSDRGGGALHLYVAGTDGHGLERVSSALRTNQSLFQQVAWSPDSTRLAVAVPGGLVYLIGSRQRLLAATPPVALAPAWSPDGRAIAVDVGTYRNPGTEVVSAMNKRSWQVQGRRIGSGWSARGRLTVRRGAKIRVYDGRGQLRMSFPGRSYAWSADGKRLATVTSDRLEVHELSGRLLFGTAVPGLHPNQHNGLVWVDGSHVGIGGTGSSAVRTIRVDVTTGRISSANNRYFGTLSPDRRLVAEVTRIAGGFALTVSRLDGSRARVLARRAPCPDLIEADLQWLSDGRSLVYDLKCEA
jgi:WD40-like Beta Propeller Repeat